MPDDNSTAATAATPGAAPAPAKTDAASTPNAVAATPETPKATALETPTETSLLDDVKAAREEVEAEGKPKPEAEAAKPEAKKEEAKKGDDEKEPEGLTEAEKNRAAWIKQQRDAQLQEAAKLAEDRKALDAEKAELEKTKAEIAAKPKTEEVKPGETKTDQPGATALENYKPITLSSYEDGENENEQKIVAGLDALAKDVQLVQTGLRSEIERLTADNKRLMDLAAPYIPDEHGITQAETQGAAQHLRGQAETASETLMAKYGPDSGLAVDPVSLIAALQEFGPGFVRIGEIKKDALFSQESIMHCWQHANKAKIDEIAAKPGTPKEEVKPVAPPIRKGEGQNSQPPSYDDMTEREKMLYDMKQEEATFASSGRR